MPGLVPGIHEDRRDTPGDDESVLMTLTVDLYWSFRSPYSYFVLGRLIGLAAEHEVDVAARPVYPLALRYPAMMKNRLPQKARYFDLDTRRVADSLGIPYEPADPDPLVIEADGGAAKDQPYIHRLTRLGAEAVRRERGLPFMHEVAKVIWGGTRNWHEGDHLAKASQRAALDLAVMDRAVAADPALHDHMLNENGERLAEAGHWGTPTMVFLGEPFFGQDRFDLLVWRLKANGLKRRKR